MPFLSNILSMKLAIHYIREMAIAIDMQSFVSLAFFLFFIFVIYVIIRGNKDEYKEFGNFPLDDEFVSENIDSQEKRQ